LEVGKGVHVAAADRHAAIEQDRVDPLRAFRDRFFFADDGVIYLDGNSLGRLPAQIPTSLDELVRTGWGTRLIRSWSEGWMELPQRIGDRLGQSLLGAAAGQVVVADSTTVCFYKLACAALDARPDRTEIITDRDNFPTDRYVLEGLASERGLTIRWIEADPSTGPEPEHVAELIGPNTALVSLSHVAYRSAFVLDMQEITRIAHASGALVLWDLCHSAGALPIELDKDDVDLAVGCTYKYLNGGPGAPAFLYVRTEHQNRLRQPIWGWLGARLPFEMPQGYDPAPGIASMLSGTPPVVALTAVGVGADLVIEAGIGAIREKAIALTEFAIAIADERLAPLGIGVGSPRDAARRGSHVALVHPQARRLCTLLIDHGVIVDYRPPDAIRLGLSPLTTSFTEVWDGLDRLRELTKSRL
jgi:kynureninase